MNIKVWELRSHFRWLIWQIIGFSAVAIGRSKIDAKQAAAKAFIEEFITNWNFPMLKENPHPVRHPDKRAETSKASSRPPRRRKRRPKKKAESKNFVGVLHEFCLIKQFPSPRYFIESQSQPEDSLTTFYTSCNVQDLQVFGAGRTMDIAKQRAAEAMCEQLNIWTNAEKLRMIDQSAAGWKGSATLIITFLKAFIYFIHVFGYTNWLINTIRRGRGWGRGLCS